MTVLQINAVYNLSSTGRTTTELHKAMLEKGICSYVAYSNTNKPDDENLYHIGSKVDTKIHAFFSRMSGKQAYYSKAATAKLLKYIDNIKPDVIHLRNLHGNYINLPMLLQYIADKDIPTVITFHDFWFITGRCFYFTSTGCDEWCSECKKCPSLSSGNPTWIFDRSKKMYDDKLNYLNRINKLAFIGVSDWAINEAKKSPIVKNAFLAKRIYNWIDLKTFYPRDTESLRKTIDSGEKKIILGVAAKWSDKKGLTGFIELSEMINENQIIILLGQMPNGIVLPHNIIAAGNTDSVAKLAEYYCLADVFVTLSLEETFGKVSAEALACGTPVVCYNSTANPELVGDGCGYVVEKNNIKAVADSIEKILAKGKQKYSQACVDYANELFNKQKLIDKYIELYKMLSE